MVAEPEDEVPVGEEGEDLVDERNHRHHRLHLVALCTHPVRGGHSYSRYEHKLNLKFKRTMFVHFCSHGETYKAIFLLYSDYQHM